MTNANDKTTATGGAFLIEACGAHRIFTPEDFSDEQRLFHKTALDFIHHEVLPRSREIEAKKEGLIPNLLRKAGEVGLLSVEIPENYGGLGLDVATSMLVAEAIAKQGSFSVSIGAHVGIGSLPIVYFGNEVQKAKYLPKINTGEILTAYALTEPGSGSDALGAKTKAVLNPEGTHYILNGAKQWITNAGFAGLFTVFAKIDGEKFTAFLVTRDTKGLSIGAEEHKMGIRGSSTCQLTFEDALVPKENILGEIGKGHKIAFNILNHGRMKLGISATGGAKHVLGISVAYAKSRKAFGQPIAEFGLIQEKIGEIASRIFVAEAMSFRTCGLIDAVHEQLDKSDPAYQQKRFLALEEFTIEASILKVCGSELLNLAVDEGVQIHGGYGYSEEYAIERAYRDSRINRIFEGTNEINRMLITGTLLKRALTGKIAWLDFFGKLQHELETNTLPLLKDGALAREQQVVEYAKRATVLALQTAAMRFMQNIEKEQEILAQIANLISDIYGMDSAISRVTQMMEAKHEFASWAELATQLYLSQGVRRIYEGARQIMIEASDTKDRANQLALIDRLTLPYEISWVKLRRALAETIIEKEAYPL